MLLELNEDNVSMLLVI